MGFISKIDVILSESITNAPRNFSKWLDMRERDLKDISRRADKITDVLTRIDDEYWIDSIIDDLEYNGANVGFDDVSLRNTIDRINREDYGDTIWKKMIEIIHSIRKWRKEEKPRVYNSSIEHLIETLQRTRKRFNNRYVDNVANANPRDIQSTARILLGTGRFEKRSEVKDVVMLLDGTHELVNDILNLINKMKAQLHEKKRKKAKMGGETIPPEHEDVETLYHASVNAEELYQDGFKDEKPGKYGLGGMGDDNLISFTSDLYNAKEIARSLKEVVMIAQGEIGLSDIVKWAKKDGMWNGVFKEDLEKRKGTKKRGIANENSPGDHYNQFDPEFQSALSKVSDEEVFKAMNEPEEVFEIYRKYLWYNDKRYNPVYSVTEQDYIGKLSKIDYRSVGVVAVKVDMTDKHDWLKAEREFRVPPESVIEVTDIIR